MKAKAKKTRRNSAVKEMSYRNPPSVNIKKAANGYVVSKYGDNGEVIEVAKTMKEATAIAKKLMR